MHYFKVCLDSHCRKFDPCHGCAVYTRGGQAFRDRQGECPIPGYTKASAAKAKTKKRVGQQKQKKFK